MSDARRTMGRRCEGKGAGAPGRWTAVRGSRVSAADMGDARVVARACVHRAGKERGAVDVSLIAAATQ